MRTKEEIEIQIADLERELMVAEAQDRNKKYLSYLKGCTWWAAHTNVGMANPLAAVTFPDYPGDILNEARDGFRMRDTFGGVINVHGNSEHRLMLFFENDDCLRAFVREHGLVLNPSPSDFKVKQAEVWLANWKSYRNIIAEALGYKDDPA